MHTEYRSDCSRCVGLCCVAAPFSKSADFAISKPAGTPCPNLGADHGCTIHAQLRTRGFPGCVSFDCYGAGQRLTEGRSDGADWRAHPEARDAIFSAFHERMGVCELGWHIDAALAQPTLPNDWLGPMTDAKRAVDAAATAPANVGALRAEVSTLLSNVSEAIRRQHGPLGPDHSRKMMLGASLRGQRLARSSFFATCLVGADLRNADLRHADLRGTDLRGADLRGADLQGVLFLTPGQLARARRD